MKASIADIAWRRLKNQYVGGDRLTTPMDVVAKLAAVQAQDYAGAKWGVALRTKNVVDADVERALNEGSILRTHVLRPTWHFVTPVDIRWMLALTAPRINRAMSYSNRAVGLDDRVFRRANRALEKAFEGGRELTRKEIATALTRARIDVTALGRFWRLLMRAELEGLVCSGARRGKQLTYALLDERASRQPPLPRDEALLTLARTYFATRGPATVGDFAWWSGLTMADARTGLELAKEYLERTELDGRVYWAGSDVPCGIERSAHLLPNYDEYFIAYKNRDALAQRLATAGAELRSNDLVRGWSIMANVVVIDGQIVGTWKRSIGRDGVSLDGRLISELTAAERRRVAVAARRYASFVGMPLASIVLS